MKTPMLFLLTLVGTISPLWAEPPKLGIPAELKSVAGYATFKPDATDIASVIYIGLDGEDAFPNDFLADKRHFLLPTRGLKTDTAYRFVAIASNKAGEQSRQDFKVVIGKPDTNIPPIKDPPKDPPVTPIGSKFFFVIVRTDNAPTLEYEQALRMPGWDELKAKGHNYKDMTAKESATYFAGNKDIKIPSETVTPFIVALQYTADGKNMTVVKPTTAKPGVIPFPKDNSEILKLPDSVK